MTFNLELFWVVIYQGYHFPPEMNIKLHVTQRRELQEIMSKVCNTAWRQCTEHLKAKIEASDKYAKLRQEANTIDLIK